MPRRPRRREGAPPRVDRRRCRGIPFASMRRAAAFLFLLVFYLAFTKVSEVVLERVMRRLTHGQATTGGEGLRRAEA